MRRGHEAPPPRKRTSRGSSGGSSGDIRGDLRGDPRGDPPRVPPGDPPGNPPRDPLEGTSGGILRGILWGILPGILRGILRGDTLGGPSGGAVNTPAPPRHVTLVAAAAVGFSAPVVAGRRWSLDVASGAGLLLSWLLCYMSFHGALSWSRPPLFNVIYNVN